MRRLAVCWAEAGKEKNIAAAIFSKMIRVLNLVPNMGGTIIALCGRYSKLDARHRDGALRNETRVGAWLSASPNKTSMDGLNP